MSAESNSEKSVSYQKKDGRSHARPSFSWYDNDKDLKVCFLVTRVTYLARGHGGSQGLECKIHLAGVTYLSCSLSQEQLAFWAFRLSGYGKRQNQPFSPFVIFLDPSLWVHLCGPVIFLVSSFSGVVYWAVHLSSTITMKINNLSRNRFLPCWTMHLERFSALEDGPGKM